MTCFKINNTYSWQKKLATGMSLLLLLLLFQTALAQDEKTALLKLTFLQTDSTKTCKATVTSNGLPVKETEVHLYVKRMYSLLPVGKVVATDENGEALISYPVDLPGDQHQMVQIIAKIEKDPVYGTVQTDSMIKWGASPKASLEHFSSRSLSASREHAPMFLVIASTLIIAVIWGTVFYILSQLFKIKKAARQKKKIIPSTV